ncbi:TPA: hypothetical protein L5627_006006 [Pseudomonas aeruginosa]|uniref:hypothetical protein n=1 Tax=Pseudomonas aeruginosa TaxID=287 RepID=UPI00398330D4|nr:hypothetical protein [Pseudomonas aeruginosa]
MTLIESAAQARELLSQNSNYVVYMRMDFSCWIREGVPDANGIPTPRGKYIAEITEEIFDEITVNMAQAYCSEFYQKEAITC